MDSGAVRGTRLGFTRLSLDRLGLASVAVFQIFLLSCGGESPVAPRLTPIVDAEPAVAVPTAGGVSAQNDPPTMVLRTTPPVDPERGAVSGPSPLTVLFNVCRSSDPDPGDTLNYQFHFGDSGRPAFNPDGSFNADFDHFCRAEHTYRSPGTYTATVSVTDKHLEDQGRDVSALARRTETVRIVVSRPARGTLTVAKAGTGTGTVTGNGISCGVTCSAPLLLGTGVSLSAVADAGSVFTGWSLPSCGSNSACAFTLTDSTTVTAIFDLSSDPSPSPGPSPPGPPEMTTLSVTKAGTGSGTVEGNGIDCGVVCAVSLPVGTHVTLGATADEGSLFGSVFTQWSVPGCGASPTCAFTLTGFTSVTATFEKTGNLVVHNAATGITQILTGVEIVGPQTIGPLAAIGPGSSHSVSTVTPGDYTALPGTYYPGLTCDPVNFTLSPGSTKTITYSSGTALGRRCTVTVE